MTTRNDELAGLALEWLKLSKKDKQYAVHLLLDRGLAEFDRNLELRLVPKPAANNAAPTWEDYDAAIRRGASQGNMIVGQPPPNP